tara:strand:+ start:81 stop:443 length:363 start_codon:yes stop_codon:yes gene_type:complete
MSKDKDIYIGDTEKDLQENDEISTGSKEDSYEHGKHPNSKKAIEKYQFKKGISGNPSGRNKKFEKLADALKELADEETFNWCGDKSLGTRRNQVLERIWDDAQSGDIKKIELLAHLGCLD